MRITYPVVLGGTIAGFLGLAVVLSTTERPPIQPVQHGFRGTGMVEMYNPRLVADGIANNVLPDEIDKIEPSGQKSSEAYQNVKVLGDVDASEFLRLMQAITAWVSPAQGCNYCHNPENLASDEVYTKVVARRMLQMVQRINSNWKTHVQGTGVTCYTCHRGQPVPSQIWFNNPGPPHTLGMAASDVGKNVVSVVAGGSSLPYDPLTPYLEGAQNIRVQATEALPGTDLSSIKQTEWTYALMMHFSTALGVNCAYCHNTREFGQWDQSTPQRTTAWYGIRMVREVNNVYLTSLQGVFPHARLGELGDTAKVNCATCHQGQYKPLYGQSMIGTWPELTMATGSDLTGPVLKQ